MCGKGENCTRHMGSRLGFLNRYITLFIVLVMQQMIYFTPLYRSRSFFSQLDNGGPGSQICVILLTHRKISRDFHAVKSSYSCFSTFWYALYLPLSFVLSPIGPVDEESVNHSYHVTDNESDLSRDMVRGCKLRAPYDLDHTGAGLRG